MKKLFHKFKKICDNYHLKPKFTVALFFSSIIFSLIGVHYSNDNPLYYLYLISTGICFALWLIILPIDEQLKNKIWIRLAVYPCMIIATLFELVCYTKIYFGYEIPILLHIFSLLLMIPIIIFFIDILECLFKFVYYIVDYIFKENNSKFVNVIKKITSFIVTITAFLTAIISLAKVFSGL